MANVHRLGDYAGDNENNRNRNYQPQFGGDQRAENAFRNQPLLGGLQNQQFVDPRRETIFDMLKLTCCPNFSVYSFIFYITMIDIIVYVVTVIISLTKGRLSDTDFLGPTSDVLISFGAQVPPKIHSGEVYRLILPVFLHAGFLHIFVSVPKK